MKMISAKKWMKWIVMICLIPIGLVLLLAVLLYIPPIQNFAVRKVTRMASEATGMQIGVERIRLAFPLDLTVEGIEIKTSPVDTLLILREASLRVNPLPLARKIVSVESLRLKEAQVNTGSFIEGMEVRGTIRSLSVTADYIDLAAEKATLNVFDLSDADLSLRIDSLSQQQDTTSVPLQWIIALGEIDFNRVGFNLEMPGDSIRLATYLDKMNVGNGRIDLGLSRYAIDRFRLADSEIRFDTNPEEPQAGIDPAHLRLSKLTSEIRSIIYHDREIGADIRSLSLEERSGLTINTLEGKLQSDSLYITIPELLLETGASNARLAAMVPWSLMDPVPSTKDSLQLSLSFALGKQDLLLAAPDLPADFKEAYPEKPVNFIAWADGNLKSLNIRQLIAEVPGVFGMSGAGTIGNVTDSLRRSADVQLDFLTEDMNFLLSYLPREQRDQYHIPSGIMLKGEASLLDREVKTNLHMTEDKADMTLTASYHLDTEAYQADLEVKKLEPIHFMPHDSILWVDARLKAEGMGTDIYSPLTWTKIDGSIDSLSYNHTALSQIVFDVSLKENRANANLNSANPGLDMELALIDASVTREEVSGMVSLKAEKIDLFALQLMDTTFTTNFDLFAEFKSDLKERNQADVTIGNWDIRTPEVRLRRQMLVFKGRSDEDTTRLSLHAGDLGITLTGNAGLNAMMNQVNTAMDRMNHQLTVDSTLDMTALRPFLPDIDLTIRAKRDNPVYNLLRRYYISYTDIDIHAATSPGEGIFLDAGIYAFARDTFLIDTLRATIRPDTVGLQYAVDVIKNRYRLQTPFSAHAKGLLHTNFAQLELLFSNHRKETGLLLGIQATREEEGITFRLYPDKPVLAFNTFDLNPDNYLRLRSMKDIDANIRLTGKENASLWLHSIDGGDTYPELHVELSQINLATITSGFAGLPPMRGILSADFQYAPMDETFMVVADAHIDELYYEKGRVGELMLNGVYLPLDNSEHQVDVHLYRDRAEITSAYALYNAAKKTNNIEGALDILSLPLPMVNAFIPDQMAEMAGVLNGRMEISGSSEKPVLNGFMQMDSSSVYLGMADTRLRFDNRKVTVKNSLISFNKYNIYSSGNNPFVIDGNIDISNFSRMMADLKMTANNMLVFDAKRTPESMVYGRLLMNFNTTIKGPVTSLTVQGDAHLLGGTNVTYVFTESPLTVQDRMDGLVTFVSFTDTLTRQRRNTGQGTFGGLDMLMVLHIDPSVQFRVDLTPDQSNYVELEGGGDLSFQYKPQGDMVLNGRYTFTGGVVNYQLPVVPLKAFNIQQGSYVQWDNEMMNPMINVVATERMRATITNSDGVQRRSNFDVGISVQDRLENMQMQFIIDTEDGTIKNELANKSNEDRARYAIYMMLTGTYMDSGSGNMDLGGALGNFLAGQVNSLAGDALKGVDINIGFESYEGEAGSQNDLTFSFAKRFYNDRIRVSVGGKVSTGSTTQQEESFLDNFAAEYLLDPAGTKTIKVFHDRNYESVLESEVVETGIGLVLRKKVRYLRELFDFRKKKVKPTEEKETIVEQPKESEDETTE